jgi:hypothetical protein
MPISQRLSGNLASMLLILSCALNGGLVGFVGGIILVVYLLKTDVIPIPPPGRDPYGIGMVLQIVKVVGIGLLGLSAGGVMGGKLGIALLQRVRGSQPSSRLQEEEAYGDSDCA